jgi:DNA polymerase (family X)
MPSRQEVAKHLERISILKALNGDNSFSVSAYKSAAYTIETKNVALTRQALSQVHGLNKIVDVILEFVEQGTSSRYSELVKIVPAGLLDIVEAVHGVGPSKAKKLHAEGITTLQQLIDEAEQGKLDPKLAKNVLLARDMKAGRIPIQDVVPLAARVINALQPVATAVEICGSFRRQRATVKDLDVALRVKGRRNQIKQILANDLPETVRNKRGIPKSLTTKIGRALQSDLAFGAATAALKQDGLLVDVGSQGDVKAGLVVAHGGITLRCDLWVFAEDWWGSGALNYATGSKEHNEKLRGMAVGMGMKVNEYGIFNRKTGKRLGGKKETDLYDLLGIDFVEPEKR